MHAPSPAAATRTLGMSACVGGISGWDEKMEEGGRGGDSLARGRRRGRSCREFLAAAVAGTSSQNKWAATGNGNEASRDRDSFMNTNSKW